jgi:hypothetical protein
MRTNDPVRADLHVCPMTKESILSKTHYGLTIYSHILRLYSPDAVVLRLVGRDCGLCRNPFNFHKETLHIWIHKTDLTNAMSTEYAKHTDTENAIPAGDAFSFAELHYNQQGNELLQTLNKELYLKIGENFNFYKNRNMNVSVGANNIRPNQGNLINPINHSSDSLFSFFRAPVTNTKPHKAVACYKCTTQSKATTTKPAPRNCEQFQIPYKLDFSKPPISTTAPFRAFFQSVTTKP